MLKPMDCSRKRLASIDHIRKISEEAGNQVYVSMLQVVAFKKVP
jgi:hypothetical protein